MLHTHTAEDFYPDLLEVTDVRKEEEQEEGGSHPLRYRADDMCVIPLKFTKLVWIIHNIVTTKYRSDLHLVMDHDVYNFLPT